MEKMIAIIKKDVFDESTDIELDCQFEKTEGYFEKTICKNLKIPDQ